MTLLESLKIFPEDCYISVLLYGGKRIFGGQVKDKRTQYQANKYADCTIFRIAPRNSQELTVVIKDF